MSIAFIAASKALCYVYLNNNSGSSYIISIQNKTLSSLIAALFSFEVLTLHHYELMTITFTTIITISASAWTVIIIKNIGSRRISNSISTININITSIISLINSSCTLVVWGLNKGDLYLIVSSLQLVILNAYKVKMIFSVFSKL